MADSRTLFKELQVGDMKLAHRLALAPLTRFRANDKHVVQDLHTTYYTQRGSTPGTLLISEATLIAPQAGGYTYAPGIWNEEQIAAWKKVVDGVHAQGSFLCQQLWSMGRGANLTSLAAEPTGPYDVVSASNIPFEGGATPRPLSVDEIKEFVGWYAQAAKNFVKLAGGDMVEIHGANGFLPDQFLQTNSNARTDNYGGSVENRARFLLEVVDAVAAAVGPSKTAVRLSPFSTFQGMKFATLAETHETFGYLVKELKRRQPDLAYLHLVEPRTVFGDDVIPGEHESLDFLYEIWHPKPFVVAGGYKIEDAIATAEKWENSLVAEGRHFISNPDLVERVRHGIAIAPYNRSTFYLLGPEHPEGYIDYPFSPKLAALKAKA